MKINFHVLACLQLLFNLNEAAVIQSNVHKRAAPHANLHSTYTSLVNGEIVTTQLLVKGYSGDVENYTIDGTYVPKYHFATTKELAIRNTDLIVRADVCVFLTDCAGYLTDFVAFYAVKGAVGLGSWCLSAASSVQTYYTANNYAHATAVLDGVVSSLAVVIPVGAITYYFNAEIAKISPTPSDACGTTQPAVLAEQVASATAEFCLSIKNQALADVTTRFSAADLNNPDSNDDETSADGVDLLMKFNLGSIEFDVLALCAANGITWKRNFSAALIRVIAAWAGGGTVGDFGSCFVL